MSWRCCSQIHFLAGQNEVIAGLLRSVLTPLVNSTHVNILRPLSRHEADALILSQARRVNTTHDVLLLDEPSSIPTLAVSVQSPHPQFVGDIAPRVLGTLAH